MNKTSFFDREFSDIVDTDELEYQEHLADIAIYLYKLRKITGLS